MTSGSNFEHCSQICPSTGVTVINLEQCCMCAVFYEQPQRQIPQTDLNRSICKALDVIPALPFYCEYLAICLGCANLLRKFDQIRVELEFVKTQIVTKVVETLTQVRFECGSSQLDGLKDQIFERWSWANETEEEQQPNNSKKEDSANENVCDKRLPSVEVHPSEQDVQTPSNPKPEVCHLCGEVFKEKELLRRHIMQHQLVDKVQAKKCPLCPKVDFRRVWILKKHMEVEHPGTQETEKVLKKYKDVDDRPKARIQGPGSKTANFHKVNTVSVRRKAKSVVTVSVSDSESESYGSETDESED